MKLLRLKIENEDGFRSLQKGFEINFHTLTDAEAMEQFRPFCFAGLNGSGKSNVLEALANIFYHLEVCVARYLPESIKDFKRHECIPDAFTLEYLIGQNDRNAYIFSFFDKITIIKKEGEAPKMYIQSYDFKGEKREVSLIPPIGRDSAAEGKVYLPDHIIGYSSGENEILSLPFVKSRLIHLDEYRQATRDNYNSFKETENSLIYIDNNMSQAVLLCCLLFENEEALAPLRSIDNTGILGLRSFRMNIHFYDFEFIDKETKRSYKIPILKILEQNQIDSLKKCATSWFLDKTSQTLWLDFYVNDATKKAFKEYFHSGLECFHFFRLLYELNNHLVDDNIKEDIYQSKGVYTNSKLPTPSPSQDVFHFLDFYITKEIKGTGERKDLLLRNFSDGEHQFIHTMGICLLLKDRRSILLLDEPETHFNPSWRAKFIKILNDTIGTSSLGNDYNVHLLKDILLTSHSPFIISDCLPDNVILFEKDETQKTICFSAKQINFNTYGTSVDLILQEIFKMPYSISNSALEEIRMILKSDNPREILEKSIKFGESYEKGFLFERVEELNSKK
jgi:restriction system-associated AAA family ATPase